MARSEAGEGRGTARRAVPPAARRRNRPGTVPGGRDDARACLCRRRKTERRAMSDLMAIAAKSMADDMARMATISHNLANATTPGFKKDIPVTRPFVEYLQTYGASPAQTFVTTLPAATTVVDQKAGSVHFTGSS